MSTFYTANVTATNGSEFVGVNNSSDDINIIRERSFLQIGTDQIVEIKRPVPGSPDRIELEAPWPHATVTGDAVAVPTAGDFVEATRLLKQVSEQSTEVLDELGGSTTVGRNYLRLPNPGAVRFQRTDANNQVLNRTAAQFRDDMGVTDLLNNKISIGQFGFGATTYPSSQVLVTGMDLAENRPSGFYRYSNATANRPSGTNGFVDIRTRSSDTVLFTAVDDNNRSFTAIWDGLSETLIWAELWTTNNTIVDSNGFILEA